MLRPETIMIQENLAGYCRTGKEDDIPGLTPGRLPHYKRLVNNVVFGTIGQAFPIARKVLNDNEWTYLLHNFFVEHDAQTPILWKLPYEFFRYVADQDYASELKKPWLNDLLWFEWLEIEVHMMPDHVHGKYAEKGDPITDPVVMNMDSKLIRLQYPVHLYPVKEVESKAGDYYLSVYREMESGTVRFLNLSPLYVRLLDLLMQDETRAAATHLPRLSQEYKLADAEALKRQINNFVEQMLKSGLVLGFRK